MTPASGPGYGAKLRRSNLLPHNNRDQRGYADRRCNVVIAITLDREGLYDARWDLEYCDECAALDVVVDHHVKLLGDDDNANSGKHAANHGR